MDRIDFYFKEKREGSVSFWGQGLVGGWKGGGQFRK